MVSLFYQECGTIQRLGNIEHIGMVEILSQQV